MKLFYPEYYPLFKCLADQCRHTCCVDWEIDIDADSMNRFLRHPDITKHIQIDEVPHFVLTDSGRCPFLEESGLCRMILCYGENMLCDICSDHPRFRNEFENCVETGLGLCCEAAAELILTRKTPFRIVMAPTTSKTGAVLSDDTAFLLSFRNDLLNIILDRRLSMTERLRSVMEYSECDMPVFSGAEVYHVLASLEILDVQWSEKISVLETVDHLNGTPFSDEYPIFAEQLLVYFIYRHIMGAFMDDCLVERVLLCVFLYLLACTLIVRSSSGSLSDALELCRMLSSELEYSDQNIDNLLDWLSEPS